MASSFFAPAAVDILNVNQLALDLTAANKAALFLTALVPVPLTNFNFTLAPYNANEVSGGGYTAGGLVITAPTWVAAGASPVVTYDANDLSWVNITATAMRWAIFYANPLANKNIYYALDFGSNFNATTGPVNVVFDVLGVFTWTL